MHAFHYTLSDSFVYLFIRPVKVWIRFLSSGGIYTNHFLGAIILQRIRCFGDFRSRLCMWLCMYSITFLHLHYNVNVINEIKIKININSKVLNISCYIKCYLIKVYKIIKCQNMYVSCLCGCVFIYIYFSLYILSLLLRLVFLTFRWWTRLFMDKSLFLSDSGYFFLHIPNLSFSDIKLPPWFTQFIYVTHFCHIQTWNYPVHYLLSDFIFTITNWDKVKNM
jgi:hypothetical protein